MTFEQPLAPLEAENERLREQLASRDTLIAHLVERIQALEARLTQDSHNSSKPPSSDGFARSPKKRSLRKTSRKKPGGQSGHEGHALKQVEQPDQLIEHFAPSCQNCQHDLSQVAPLGGFEPRQVFELPLPLKLAVTEHRAYTTKCPACQHSNKAPFPPLISNWVQYGPGFRAGCPLGAVYLVQYQLLPYARACELLNEIYSENVSPGTLVALMAQCYDHLAEPEKSIKAALSKAKIVHCDESGTQRVPDVEGKRTQRVPGFHVTSNNQLTHYVYHPKRGSAATDEIGILPAFAGTAVHDGYTSYTRYGCEHAGCPLGGNAHHLRELNFVHEQLGQSWAGEFKQLLLDLKGEVERAKAEQQSALRAERLAHYERTYQLLIDQALAANPSPAGGWLRGARGRAKQSKAKNLLDRLDSHRRQVLLFGYRFEVPFDNNQAERDIRMVKVQQKVSGCFRSKEGAAYFCRIRGYLSTMKKQGHNLFLTLLRAFVGQPLLPQEVA